MKIEELNLSIRSYHCLKFAGIETVERLRELSPDDLYRIRNIGAKNIKEIKEKLKEVNL